MANKKKLKVEVTKKEIKKPTKEKSKIGFKNQRITAAEKYPCTVCEKTFPRSWNLKNHLRIHQKTRPQTQCPYCTSKFYDAPNVRRHCLIYHPEKKSSKSLSELKWENVTNNISDQMPTCTICQKSFTREENLASHIMRMMIS